MGAGSKRVVRDDDSSSSDGEAVRDTGMHSTQKAAASADKGKGKGTSRKDGQGAVGMSKRRRGRDGSGSESEESGQGGDGAGRDAGLSLDLASVTDAHRLFVHMCMKEAGMQKGADAEAMATLHRHVCERTGVGYNPSQNAFAAFMSALNEHLAFLDLEFASLADPDSGRRYWALVNTAADDVAQFATTLNANEIAFLKKVIQLIMTADDGVFQIPVSEALHESKLAKLTMQATETLIDTIIGSGWLAKNECMDGSDLVCAPSWNSKPISKKNSRTKCNTVQYARSSAPPATKNAAIRHVPAVSTRRAARIFTGTVSVPRHVSVRKRAATQSGRAFRPCPTTTRHNASGTQSMPTFSIMTRSGKRQVGCLDLSRESLKPVKRRRKRRRRRERPRRQARRTRPKRKIRKTSWQSTMTMKKTTRMNDDHCLVPFFSVYKNCPMTPTSWQPVDRPALNVETDFTTADIDAQLAARVSRYNCLERVRLCGFAKHAPNSLLVIGRDGSSVSDRAGNEVHLVDTRTGECAQLSALCSGDNLGANIMFLSPLSSGFLFGLDSGGNEAASLWSGLADKSDPTKFQFKELVPVAKGGRVKVGRVVVSADELTLAYTFNERNNSLQDIFILRRKSKDTPWSESTPVLAHEATVPGVHLITFTSDNRLIFAVAQSASSTLAFIAHLDPATGLLVTPIALQLPGARSSNVSIWDIVASHTSKDLFYVASDAYNEFHGLVEWNTATDTVRHVTTPGVVGTPCPLPWDLNSSVVAGSRVIFGVNENGRSLLKVLDTVDWRVASVEIPVGVVTGLVVDKSDFGRVSFTLDSTRHPSTLFELELDTMALRILSINLGSSAHSQETEEKLVRDPELITYKSFDGLEISAFLYTPPPEKASEGVKLPVVVYIHGGPASQYLPKYLPSNHSLSMRYLTDEMGIACVAPNIRGSIGYGSAFMEADDRLKREDALKDIESLVSWIALQPNLDPTRIAIMGRSYGGWAVLAALVFYPRAFKCGLATCGMSNFFTFYENTGPWRVDNRRQEYGDERIPAEREFLEKISPALHAEQITVPLYLAIGENDTRVPLSEAVQMAATVRERAGVDVWTLVGKKEGHVFEQKSVKDFHAVAQVAFLEKYLLA